MRRGVRSKPSRPPRTAPGTLPPISSRMTGGRRTTVGVFVYRGVSSSEVDEPVARLAERLAADVVTVGAAVGSVNAVEPSRAIEVDCDPSSAPPIDVLVVPGGLGWKQVISDIPCREWLQLAARDAKGILAISTGSLLLATVGRLEGRSATGHWLAETELAALGAVVTTHRTASADGGRVVTAAGALAALHIIDELAAQTRGVDWMRPST